MIGSGAFGNWRRASLRSPPCRSRAELVSGMMAITLTLFALLIEATFGYPDWLVRTIGHPVTWMGRLISALDRSLNREALSPAKRRWGGAFALVVITAVAGAAAAALESALSLVPFGVAIT